MKYNKGDRVKIKSLDWYKENKSKRGHICFDNVNFMPEMSRYCGEILTINRVVEEFKQYFVSECGFAWTDEMIECKVEEETKPEPKFKVGDKIKLKSTLLNDIFDVIGYEPEGYRITNISNGLMYFMSYSIGHYYELVEEETKFGTASNPIEPKSNANCLTRERVDELATKIDKELPSGNQNVWELPDGYQFVDENGNVINATIIALEKKKTEYPKTYEECAKIMNCPIVGPNGWLFNFDANIKDSYYRKIDIFMGKFTRLLICRDAYWKIAGEEMGLGKPWEPDCDYNSPPRYIISYYFGDIIKEKYCGQYNRPLSFPTEEMRDAFYDNFKKEIEECKELL